MRPSVTSRLKTCVRLTAAAVLLGPGTLSAQTPAQDAALVATHASTPATTSEGVQTVVDAYVQALGGRDELNRWTLRRLEGYIELPNRDYSSGFLSYWQAPDHFWLGVAQPEHVTQNYGYDGVAGWRGGAGEWGTYETMTHREIKDLLRVMDPLGAANLMDIYSTVVKEVPAPGSASGTDVLRVRVEGGTLRFLFDSHSHLLSEIEEQRGDEAFPRHYRFKNYKKVDGIKFPFVVHEIVPIPNIDPASARIEKTIHFNKVVHNVELPDKVFRPPVNWKAVAKKPESGEEQ